jgi:hypothetical protein
MKIGLVEVGLALVVAVVIVGVVAFIVNAAFRFIMARASDDDDEIPLEVHHGQLEEE